MNLSRRLAAVALSVAAALVAMPAPSPAIAQTVFRVTQGQTISLGQLGQGGYSLNPPEAGTLTFERNTGEARFTASASFTGTATINDFDPAIMTVYAVLIVGAPSGDVEATFTPRPAPGPCITLTGTSVDFGDVEVGTAAISDVGSGTTIGSCTTIGQELTVQISDATAGAVTWEPTKEDELSPNTFRWEVNPGLYNLRIDNEPTFFGRYTPGFIGGAPIVDNHRLSIAPGSTTGLGEQFSATLTFTAMARTD